MTNINPSYAHLSVARAARTVTRLWNYRGYAGDAHLTHLGRGSDLPPLQWASIGPCHTHSSQLILLLVEDEPLIQMMTQDALEAAGYGVIAVGNAVDAERSLAKCEVAGLITDIRLGSGPDGWELAQRARELYPTLPVIYATGNNAAQWPVHGVADSVLVQKPYSSAEIVAGIALLLDGSAGHA